MLCDIEIDQMKTKRLNQAKGIQHSAKFQILAVEEVDLILVLITLHAYTDGQVK